MAVRDDTRTSPPAAKADPVDAPPVRDAERAARRAAARRRTRNRRIIGGVLGVLVLAVGINAMLARGEVARGTSVAGVDVGGLSRAEASRKLDAVFAQRLKQPIDVRVEGEESRVVPWKAGIRVDVAKTVDAAMGVGRVRAMLLPFGGSDEVEPVLAMPATPELPRGLVRLERKPVDAKPSVDAAGHVKVVPSQTGLEIAPKPAIQAIANASAAGATTVAVKGELTQPEVTTEDANAVASETRQLLSGPIALTRKGKRIGVLTPAELAPVLVIDRLEGDYRVRVAPERLRDVVSGDVEPYLKDPVDASWETDGRTATLIPAKDGIDMLAVPTARHLRSVGIGDGARRVEVSFGPRAADLDTKKAKAWGIRKLVSSVTTDLGDSSENRIHNVGLMAEILDGHVIAPGETFSFNEVVGPRTEDRGFLEGQAIVNGLLVPSIGGGVCQVATTVFGAAFYAGLPIGTRMNHSFYISHYDLGMDATVSWGGPDLTFTNDTKYAILIRTAANDSTMTVNMYSTPTGVEVEKTTSDRSSPTQPGVRYISDPTLPRGAVVQTSTGVGGFTVVVGRTVRQDGEVVRQDSFTSVYVPEDVIYRVGPGGVIPGDATLEPPPPATA